jgi:hypothetical protein
MEIRELMMINNPNVDKVVHHVPKLTNLTRVWNLGRSFIRLSKYNQNKSLNLTLIDKS